MKNVRKKHENINKSFFAILTILKWVHFSGRQVTFPFVSPPFSEDSFKKEDFTKVMTIYCNKQINLLKLSLVYVLRNK